VYDFTAIETSNPVAVALEERGHGRRGVEKMRVSYVPSVRNDIIEGENHASPHF
jgi:hypothetical protein